MKAWVIVLIVVIILLAVTGLILGLYFGLRKTKPNISDCTFTVGGTDSIFVTWKSTNSSGKVNIYASINAVTFDDDGKPNANGADIFKGTPDVDVSVGKGNISTLPQGEYNVYAVITNDGNYNSCEGKVSIGIENQANIMISSGSLFGAITRNGNSVSYIASGTKLPPAPTPLNTWFYAGITNRTINGEIIRAYTLSNTDPNGTRYYLYDNNGTLAVTTDRTTVQVPSKCLPTDVSQFSYAVIERIAGTWIIKQTAASCPRRSFAALFTAGPIKLKEGARGGWVNLTISPTQPK